VEIIILLEKIPLLRGWLWRWRNMRAKHELLEWYQRIIELLAHTPILSISYEKNSCVYQLEDGRKFRFRPDKAAGWLYTIPYSGNFEVKETCYVKRTVERGWVCLDVGGCFGWYTLLFAELAGPDGLVHVFEPVPDNRECLVENIALNGCSNVTVHPYALGEKLALTTIYVPEGGVSGSLRAHGSAVNCKAIDVQVSTLDDFMQASSFKRLDFIKADIEGAELLMLKGGINVLMRFKPMLMLEVQARSTCLFGYDPKDLFRFMQELGYAIYWVDMNGSLKLFDESVASKALLPDYNFIFIHKDNTV
jgi:FkbM family methyltransferase